MTQNKHHSHLPERHFVHTFGHNMQSIGCTLVYYIPNDLPTIGDVLLDFFVAYELQLASYNSKHV